MITVQYCPCGHVSSSDDPKHIELDEKRRAEGYLDALILSTFECEDCKDEERRQMAKYAEYDIYPEDL